MRVVRIANVVAWVGNENFHSLRFNFKIPACRQAGDLAAAGSEGFIYKCRNVAYNVSTIIRFARNKSNPWGRLTGLLTTAAGSSETFFGLLQTFLDSIETLTSSTATITSLTIS